MTISIEKLKALAAAGATVDVIIAAVESDLIADAEKRRKAKNRQRRHRSRVTGVTSRDMSVTERDSTPIVEAPAAPPTTPCVSEPRIKEEKTPPEKGGVSPSYLLPLLTVVQEERSESVALGEREFAEFWSACKHKVGKLDARKSYKRARKLVSHERLVAAMTAYGRKTDDRPWCNPATWLNQGRWDDQPALEVVFNGNKARNGGGHGSWEPPRGSREDLRRRNVLAYDKLCAAADLAANGGGGSDPPGPAFAGRVSEPRST